MSILIKGMEMPKNCCECIHTVWNGWDDVCRFSGISALNIGRQADCPLIEVQEWIPVAERLPEEKGNYLVVQDCGHGAEVHEAFFFKYFDSLEWYDPVEEYQQYNPTHWMPLPEPPKVDGL